MNPVSRRSLLRSTALVPAALVVANCSALTGGVSISQVSSDIATIASGLAGILPTIAKVAGVTTGVMSTIGTATNDLQKIASAVSSATSTAATTMVGTVENVVGGVLSAVSGISLPSSLSTVFSAISALLPAIEQGVGIVTALVAPAPARFARATAAMSPDQARAVLIAAAGVH